MSFPVWFPSSANKLTQAHMKCIVDQFDKKGRRFDSADDAPDTSYYQWVVFVFAFQANFVKLITKSTKQQEGKIFR